MDFASEVLDCLKYGRADKNYSENVRQFSIALSYYSPNAYRYIRSVFHRQLPDPRTMRLWMSSIDASPGITNEALKVLEMKEKVYKANGKKLLIYMAADEVSIKKKVEYNQHQQKFEGFVTCMDNENNEDSQGLPVAKNALVFMAIGDDFKIAVAYFLLTGLNELGRAALTQLVIRSVNETGAKVVSLTQVNNPLN